MRETTPEPRQLPTSGWIRWLPLGIVLCGTVIVVADTFVVNVALPSIQRTLGAGPDAIQWIIAGTQLAMASLLVCGGRLGDRYGRRRLFSIGIAVFILGSALGGLSPSPPLLVAARVVQGLGGALLTPQIFAIISVTYSGTDRVRAIAAYAVVAGVSAVGAEVIGGLLLQADPAGLGWRTVFWVNVPVGLAALLLTRHFVPESSSGERDPVDVAGAGLLLVAMLAIMLPLVDGRQAGWPAWSWFSLAASVPLFALFALHLVRTARQGGKPLLDPQLFAVPSFRVGLLVQLCFNSQQAAGLLVIALFLQEGLGLSPLEAGGMFAVLAAGFFGISLAVPSLAQRVGRGLIGIGALGAAAGNLLLALAVARGGTEVPLVALAPGLLLDGAGQGLCMTPLISVVMAGADESTAGSITGSLTTTQLVGDAIGIGLIGLVYFAVLSRGAAPAFAWSSVAMGVLLLLTAGLSRLLPSTTSLVTAAPAPEG